MKVKIGNTIYDSNDEPIMLILEEQDKTNISNMGEQRKYCSYPEHISVSSIVNFMKEESKGLSENKIIEGAKSIADDFCSQFDNSFY